MPGGSAASRTRLTLPALLAARVGRGADSPLFSDRATAWTAAQAMDAAARWAGALAAHGIARGDRVALLCSNRKEFMEIVLGCAWLGAVVVPVNIASRGMQLAYGNTSPPRPGAARSVAAARRPATGCCGVPSRNAWPGAGSTPRPSGGTRPGWRTDAGR